LSAGSKTASHRQAKNERRDHARGLAAARLEDMRREMARGSDQRPGPRRFECRGPDRRIPLINYPPVSRPGRRRERAPSPSPPPTPASRADVRFDLGAPRSERAHRCSPRESKSRGTHSKNGSRHLAGALQGT
jgi:hypothetical protein